MIEPRLQVPEQTDEAMLPVPEIAPVSERPQPATPPADLPRDLRSKFALAAVAAVVLIGGGVLYVKLGRPDAIHSAAIARMSVPKAGASAVGTPDVPGANHAGDMETMIKRLSDKLVRDPANGEGWFLLARSHLEMGRHLEAADAFSKAIAQLPPDLGLFADFADARVMADGKQWTKAARDALQRAIELDPKHVKSLALLGSEAFERRAYAEAMSFWQRVTEVASPGSIEALEARANLDEAKVLAAGGTPSARASAAASPVSVGGGSLPINALAALSGAPGAPLKPASEGRQAPVAGVAAIPAAGSQTRTAAGIGGTVELAESLRGKARNDDTVFIVAKPVDGSAAPLAVMRTRVADLPYRFRLDDSQAMVAGRTLSRFPEALVHARLSATGDAIPLSGDPASEAVRVKLGTEGVRLILGASAQGSR